jgi:hypothetical protein
MTPVLLGFTFLIHFMSVWLMYRARARGSEFFSDDLIGFYLPFLVAWIIYYGITAASSWFANTKHRLLVIACLAFGFATSSFFVSLAVSIGMYGS